MSYFCVCRYVILYDSQVLCIVLCMIFVRDVNEYTVTVHDCCVVLCNFLLVDWYEYGIAHNYETSAGL